MIQIVKNGMLVALAGLSLGACNRISAAENVLMGHPTVYKVSFYQGPDDTVVTVGMGDGHLLFSDSYVGGGPSNLGVYILGKSEESQRQTQEDCKAYRVDGLGNKFMRCQ